MVHKKVSFEKPDKGIIDILRYLGHGFWYTLFFRSFARRHCWLPNSYRTICIQCYVFFSITWNSKNKFIDKNNLWPGFDRWRFGQCCYQGMNEKSSNCIFKKIMIFHLNKFFRDTMTFVLEDAAELFIQYFLVDKYIKAKNNFVIANGAIMSVISIAAFIGYIRIMKQHDDITLSRLYLLDALTVLFVTMTHVARTYSVIYQMSQEKIKTGSLVKSWLF